MLPMVAGSDLYPSLYEFLTAQGLEKTAKQLLKEAAVTAPPPAADVSLLDMYKEHMSGLDRKSVV